MVVFGFESLGMSCSIEKRVGFLGYFWSLKQSGSESSFVSSLNTKDCQWHHNESLRTTIFAFLNFNNVRKSLKKCVDQSKTSSLVECLYLEHIFVEQPHRHSIPVFPACVEVSFVRLMKCLTENLMLDEKDLRLEPLDAP